MPSKTDGFVAVRRDLKGLSGDITQVAAVDPAITAKLQADVAQLRKDLNKLQRDEKRKPVGLFVKVTRTFVATFVSALLLTLLPAVEDIAKGTTTFGVLRSLAVSAALGALAAAVRAVMAYLPLYRDDANIGAKGSVV